MAHHDDDLSVDGELVVEIVISVLKVVDLAVKGDQSVLVLNDLLSVILDVGVVLIDVLVIHVDVVAHVADAVTEGSNGLTKGLSTDEHVTGLHDLELISVLTEESTMGIEDIDGSAEVGHHWVGGGGSLATTVMVMLGVRVIVGLVGSPVVALDVLGLDGSSSGGHQGSSETFVHDAFILVVEI